MFEADKDEEELLTLSDNRLLTRFLILAMVSS